MRNQSKNPQGGRQFICTGYVPEGSSIPSTLTCTAVDEPTATDGFTEPMNYLVKGSRPCGDKIGRREFSACVVPGPTTADIISELIDTANLWAHQYGEEFAEELCSEQKCDSKSGQCSLLNWNYTVNQKGLVSNLECPYGIYIVEVVIIAECRCEARKCGKNEFSKPIVLTSTMCPVNGTSVEATCTLATTSLMDSVNQLASTFCERSECHKVNNRCSLKKVKHSRVKCKRVIVNDVQCVKAKVKIYGVNCGCTTVNI